MQNKKVIAITLYRRPNYTDQLFKALNQCYGIGEYHVLISCDIDPRYQGQCDRVVQLAHEFQAQHPNYCHIDYHNPRLGVDLNKLFILPKAYTFHDYVIFLEDDTIPGQDALRYFEYCDSAFKDEKEVIAICGYNRYLEPETHLHNITNRLYDLDRGEGFTPWGWAMHHDRYLAIMGNGDAYKEKWGEEANGRFDWWFSDYAKANSCYSVYPVVPRIQSVGGMKGEHTPSPEWHAVNEWNPYGIWNQPVEDPTGKEWKKSWLT